MEFFTVFSASRYPRKEGFNQGALLTLKPNGEHKVLRYTTEEDEPLVNFAFTAIDEANTGSKLCSVDSKSILRSLQEAAGYHKSNLVESLKQLSKQHGSENLPFDVVVDVLIQTLRLDESGLKKPGALLAIARALLTQPSQDDDAIPQTIGLSECIYALVGDENYNDVGEMMPYYPWLRAVFEMVDANHDGTLSKAEWLNAVTKINSKLPKGTKPINGEATWELLDLNGDGHVSSSEWDQLGKIFC